MPSIKSYMRRILKRVAGRVHQHDLFEQPDERPKQDPLMQKNPSASEEKESPIVSLENVSIEAGEVKAISSEALLNWLNTVQYPIIVNHWATWCDPCQEELALLAELEQKIDDAILIGVSWELFEDGRLPIDTAVHRIKQTSDAHHLAWANWLIKDDPDTFFDSFKLSQRLIPQTWVIKPGKANRWEHHGILTTDDVASILAALK